MQAFRRFAHPRVVAKGQKIGFWISSRWRRLPYRFIDPVKRKLQSSCNSIRDVADYLALRQEYRIHIDRGVADVARQHEAGSAINGNLDDESTLSRHPSHRIEGAFDYLFRQLG